MEQILFISVKTLTGFIVLLLLTRLLGKKQLSQMNFFTYITGIAMGNIAAEMVSNKNVRVIDGITALVLWTVLTIVIEIISLKSSKARIILDGEPAIVIKKGIIQKKAMKRSRLNMDDLSMMLRTKDVFSVKDVEYAILEPNGEMTVLKVPENETVTKKDMNVLTVPRRHLPAELIVDGKVVSKNMEEFNINQTWLENQLKSAGVLNVKHVFFAEIQSDGSLFVGKTEEQ
ncbi:uncharacterized membrane protein YcaP (DUF421 family) [Scopulibacillus darangshiensis]|uniref:Uncharacterized membrane protein YcaP (DUF421 family) n=1 Tax=Scopulibacillus darangshiensis TaxID=442528 RepID=A0A4V2SKE9_9BACL|nr:DUF421 domain-containing protein [Scopulibacillus darangshiensis]TCP19296.1 uncharacterized membrane protein YcaP (DUF421 family) [Scopulibacillus darangshiensis]